MVDVSTWAKVDWKGHWIWLNTPEPTHSESDHKLHIQSPILKEDMNVYTLFRRKFTIKSEINAETEDLD